MNNEVLVIQSIKVLPMACSISNSPAKVVVNQLVKVSTSSATGSFSCNKSKISNLFL